MKTFILSMSPVAAWLFAMSCETPTTRTDEPQVVQKAATLADLAHLFESNNVAVDLKRSVVTLEGVVCIDKSSPLAGDIEVFACAHGAKEYESLLNCETSGTALVAALFTVGATRGSHVGTLVFWEEGRTKKFATAQNWVAERDATTPYHGSWRFSDLGDTSGELINTSNGGGVLNLDPLPASNTTLPTAFPPKGTKVRIEIKVHLPPTS